MYYKELKSRYNMLETNFNSQNPVRVGMAKICKLERLNGPVHPLDRNVIENYD